MDRAIVIDRLNEMADYLRNKSYSDLLARDFYDTVGYAILLLKEQEPVEPYTDSEGTCSCGNCGETVGYFPVGCSTPQKFCKFCPECGKPVKWE